MCHLAPRNPTRARSATDADKPATRSRLRWSLLLWLWPILAAPGSAQPTNVAVYQELALRCLGAAPDTARTFVLEAPADAMPYLRAALADHWLQAGRVLFLADSARRALPAPRPRLHYAVEASHVTYAHARRRRLHRTVTLALRYTLTDAEGRLLREQRCRETFTDTIRRSEHVAVEDAAFPETRAPLPPAGWVARYLEPAVLTAATAVGVFLFFSLRSTRSESE